MSLDKFKEHIAQDDEVKSEEVVAEEAKTDEEFAEVVEAEEATTEVVEAKKQTKESEDEVSDEDEEEDEVAEAKKVSEEEDEDSEEDEEELEDRVVDLEDKLDELMSEFEGLMNDNDAEGEELDGIEGDLEAEDDVEVEVEPGMNDVGTDDEELPMPMEEAVNLKPVKADSKDGTDSTANKSPILANGGAKEGLAEPHKIPSTDTPEKGRPAPSAKELPHGTTEPNLSPAPAPVKQDTADNKKSVN